MLVWKAAWVSQQSGVSMGFMKNFKRMKKSSELNEPSLRTWDPFLLCSLDLGRSKPMSRRCRQHLRPPDYSPGFAQQIIDETARTDAVTREYHWNQMSRCFSLATSMRSYKRGPLDSDSGKKIGKKR